MTRKYVQLCLLPACAAFSISGAQASSISFIKNYGVTLSSSQGNTLHDTFDISSEVTLSSITSASITFSFSDDGDDVATWADPYREFSHRISNGAGKYDYYTTVNNVKDFDRDTSWVGGEITGSYFTRVSKSNLSSTGSYVYNGENVFFHDPKAYCDQDTFFGICTDWDAYSQIEMAYTDTLIYSGSYETVVNLTAINSINSYGTLSALIDDGLIAFDVGAYSYSSGFVSHPGDVILQSATLTVEFQPVPLPASIWLLGSGLLGLIGAVTKPKRLAKQLRIDIAEWPHP